MAVVNASWATHDNAVGLAFEIAAVGTDPSPQVRANWTSPEQAVGVAFELLVDPGGPPPDVEVGSSWFTGENAVGLAFELAVGSVVPPGTQVGAEWLTPDNAIGIAFELLPGIQAPLEVGASWVTPENAIGIAFELAQFVLPPEPPPPPISGISVSAIREGLARTLSSIPGFQISPWVLSKPSPPTIQIRPGDIDYDKAFNRGLDFVTMIVQAFVGLNDGQSAQRRLDELLAPQGPNSVKNVLESDRQLGGIVEDLRVTRCSGYGEFTRADGSAVLGAEWEVQIYASGL